MKSLSYAALTAFTESRLGSVEIKNSGLVSRVHVLGGCRLVGGVKDMADVKKDRCWGAELCSKKICSWALRNE